MTFRFCDAEIIVGANVGASSGSTSSPASSVDARARATTRRRGGGTSPSDGPQERLDLLLDLRLGRYAAIRSISRRGLDERVVGDPRHRRVPGAAVHADAERRASSSRRSPQT